MPATGAAKAYHESQSRIFSTETPQFVGAAEGTDNLDFLADLSALKVINPDAIHKEAPSAAGPVPESPSPLLSQLMHESIPYSHCAWCTETPKTRSMLEERYYEIHHVVLQPPCCAPPSVFQTIMAWEFSFSLRKRIFIGHVSLRAGIEHEEAKNIIGATCAVHEDKTKEWYVRLPHLEHLGDTSLVAPELFHLLDNGLDKDCMSTCLILLVQEKKCNECQHGGLALP